MKKATLAILLVVALCVVACQKSNDPTTNRDPNVATLVVSNVKGDTVPFEVHYYAGGLDLGLLQGVTPTTYQIEVTPKTDTIRVGVNWHTYERIGRRGNWGLKLEVYYKGELKGTKIVNSIDEASGSFDMRCPIP